MQLAFDRSERFKDQDDGNLHVRVTNISKATVNPYRGSEIPGWQALGLDPDRIYQMFRSPEELRKGADTFNNLRLLSKHVAVSASDPKEDLVAGSTGTDARFDGEFLTNSLVIWRAADIAKVESGEKCELSCAYYYDPVMTPGSYKGLRYDGQMCNIRGNHVALVEEGRAGPDVMVADSMENIAMLKPLASRKALIVKGALAGYLAPKLKSSLAMDTALAGVTRANWRTEKPKVEAAIIKLATPLLAADANLEDLHAFIDRMDKEEDGAAEDDDLEAAADEDEDETEEEKKARLEAEARAKDKAKDKAKDRAKDKAKDRAKDADPDDDKKDGKAMDAALRAHGDGIIARMNAIAEAREVVRPLIGAVALSMDSAAGIYRLALDHLKIDVTGVDPSAYKPLVEVGKRQAVTPANKMASDSVERADVYTQFPALNRIFQH